MPRAHRGGWPLDTLNAKIHDGGVVYNDSIFKDAEGNNMLLNKKISGFMNCGRMPKTCEDVFAMLFRQNSPGINAVQEGKHDYIANCANSEVYPQKINLPTDQRGCDNSETTVGELSAKRILIFLVYFCKSF